MKKYIFFIIIFFLLGINLKAQETPINIVKTFLNYLSYDVANAYELTDNPAWGDKNKFTSKKAFGGIKQVNILEIKNEPYVNDMACVYAEVEIFDPENSNGRYKEKYYLKKYGETWKIVKLKVTKIEKVEIPEKKYYESYFNGKQLELGSSFYQGDYKYYPGNYTGSGSDECLIECSFGGQYNSMSYYVVMIKELESWKISVKNKGYSINAKSLGNDRAFVAINAYNESFPRQQCYTNHFGIRGFLGYGFKMLFEETNFYPGESWVGTTDIEKGELLYDNTVYILKDVNNDGVNELVVDYDRTYATEDWSVTNSDITIESYLENSTYTIKQYVTYFLELYRFQLLTDNYNIEAFAIYEDEGEESEFQLNYYSNINTLCDKIRLELELPSGGGANDKLQVIVSTYNGENYGEETYLEESFNKTIVLDLRNKQVKTFTFPVKYNCRNLEYKVFINDKIILKRVMSFECGE